MYEQRTAFIFCALYSKKDRRRAAFFMQTNSRARHPAGTGNVDGLAGDGVCQRQPRGPQGGGAVGLAAIADIPQQGEAAGGELHPDLVGAAGVQLHAHQRQAVRFALDGVAEGRLADALRIRLTT